MINQIELTHPPHFIYSVLNDRPDPAPIAIIGKRPIVLKMVTRPRKQDEQPTDLLFRFGNGHCAPYRARVAADTEVSIGRTNSKRALGFMVSRGRSEIDFVLDKDQVAELAAYLQITHGRLLKPLGRKPVQILHR